MVSGAAVSRMSRAGRFPGATWEAGEVPDGVDTGALDGAIDRLMGDTGAMGLTQALIVVHDGRIVREAYGPGGGEAVPLISWSVAKSVTNALVGIAVGDGVVDLDEDHLFDAWSGDGRCRISLRHLMHMSSGLAWSEDYVDAGVSNVIEMLFAGQDESPSIDAHGRLDPGRTSPIDAAGYAMSMPLAHEPGSAYCYSSGTTNLVARHLAARLGEPAGSSSVMRSFMNERLFAPIGMTSAEARFDRAGTFVGSSYVFATARDFARFGWLFANDGMWDGARILPEGWVGFSATQVARDPENGLGYGAHWWVFPGDEGSMCGLGYEGQYVYVSPRRGLVVVRLGRTEAPLNPNLGECVGAMVGAFPTRG